MGPMIQSPDILHKTEAGAVALNAATADEVGAAYDRILASSKAYKTDARIEGVLVQVMAAKGREVILGINRDPHFGPMLMLGLGGIHVEVLKDVVFAPVPVSRPEAQAMIGRLKGAGIRSAVRGQPAAGAGNRCASHQALAGGGPSISSDRRARRERVG